MLKKTAQKERSFLILNYFPDVYFKYGKPFETSPWVALTTALTEGKKDLVIVCMVKQSSCFYLIFERTL